MSLIPDLTPEQVLALGKIAVDFGRAVAGAGEDPVAKMQELVDSHPLINRARIDVDAAEDRKFGPR